MTKCSKCRKVLKNLNTNEKLVKILNFEQSATKKKAQRLDEH